MDTHDPMLEIFIYEAEQLLATLENILLEGEKVHALDDEQVNEIFRIMHTIKGSSSMMSFDSLAHLAHAVEDLFSQIREKKARSGDWDNIFDIVLTAADHIKADIARIMVGEPPASDSAELIDSIHHYLELISHRKAKPGGDGKAQDDGADDEGGDLFADAPYYKIKVAFEPECQMENMRAFSVVNALGGACHKIAHLPADLMVPEASEAIIAGGFILYIQSSENPDELKRLVDDVMFLQSSSLIPIADDHEDIPTEIRPKRAAAKGPTPAGQAPESTAKQNFISVNVNKLDKLLNLVGEIVTTESIVTKNPEVAKLKLESFERSGQQLRKLINELQDIVMSIRMVPVSTTFHKMQRIVRDMSKKVSKEVNFVIVGEETELDKNIIDTLSDPLMHLIRNAVDHGLEQPTDRQKAGKSTQGTLTLEARNTGGDVMILISDDGRGLDRAKLLQKAAEKGLLTKPESEYSDKEAFNIVFLPGFSTKDEVTEFSGRGVGMDVVRRNIEKIGGSISVDSAFGEGTTFHIRIPLTLAIIEGMKLKVGDITFIVPMLSIQESFKPNMDDVFLDPGGSEMIMIRGECYPILRLHELFDIEPEFRDFSDGILIMLSTEPTPYCLLVDHLVGEQQAVIKPLPTYIQRHNQTMRGIGGCAILGDGSISLIIDINNLVSQ